MKKLWIIISVCWLWTCGGGGGSPTEPLQPPVVGNINLEANEDTPKTFTFVGIDPNNLALTYSISTQPQNGTVQVSGSAGTYTPNENFNGQDTFLYIATSTSGSSNAGIVLVNVSPEDDQPIFISQSLTTEEDTNLKIVFEYEEFDGQDVKFSWGGGASHGTITFDDQSCSQSEINDGTCDTVNYGPNENYFGTDTFGVTIEDVNSKRVPIQSGINITITPVNDAPTVNDINNVEAFNGKSVDITLNGSDIENDNLTFEIVDSPNNGTVSISGNIATFYATSIGSDTFTYRANDGTDNSDPATVTLSINQYNVTFGGSGSDYANSVLQTSDGGFILAGSRDANDFYLVKTDASGNEIWSNTFGGYMANSVQQTSDGEYILAGSRNDNVYLVKTDASGNEIWSKTFGRSGIEFAYSIQQTSDGEFILAGYTTSSSVGYSDMYLVKTDASGNEIWSQTFGRSGADTAHSVQQTFDGGFILAGTTDTPSNDADMYLVKTDASGNEIWSQTFGGSGNEQAFSVQQTSDGGFILAGRTGSFGAGNLDMYLVKTDASGNQEWSQTFGGSGKDESRSVQQTSDGGFILAGFTGSFGAGYFDMYLVKTDASGNEIWSQTFGGSELEQARSVQQTSDGGFILAGITESFGAGNYDMYLVKTDSQGNQEW